MNDHHGPTILCDQLMATHRPPRVALARAAPLPLPANTAAPSMP